MVPRILDEARERLRDSILLRPVAFILVGLGAAVVMLAVDGAPRPTVPASLRFDPAVARSLFVTLAGATLTIAGITFWVRAAAVQMAASQFTPRVVQSFLHDWFQQSMMGLLLGIFTYLVVVLRSIPEAGDPPHLSVLVGIGLAGSSVLAVLWAIRNGVESMQASELARRITDVTVERIRKHHPAITGRRPAPSAASPPKTPGHVVRASSSGWVQAIDEERLLGVLNPKAVVRLEVRVGLFVREGRALCTIWANEGVWLDLEPRVRRTIRLGRTRTASNDIHYGLQQLADVARGSLTHGVADPGAAGEVVVHLELILRELLGRELPPVSYADEQGRQMIRRRDYSVEDYVAVAFDELRRAATPYPSVVTALLDTWGTLVRDLADSQSPERADALVRQARLTLDACAHAGLPEEEFAAIRTVAGRHGLTESPAGGDAGSMPTHRLDIGSRMG